MMSSAPKLSWGYHECESARVEPELPASRLRNSNSRHKVSLLISRRSYTEVTGRAQRLAHHVFSHYLGHKRNEEPLHERREKEIALVRQTIQSQNKRESQRKATTVHNNKRSIRHQTRRPSDHMPYVADLSGQGRGRLGYLMRHLEH